VPARFIKDAIKANTLEIVTVRTQAEATTAAWVQAL